MEISSSAGNAAAVPSYRGSVQSTRSCTANDNCNYSVHVISVYEARNRGFRDHAPGSASVHVTVSGDQSDTRPLILVLASYEPISWSISMPQGVTFEKILVVSSSSGGIIIHIFYTVYNCRVPTILTKQQLVVSRAQHPSRG